MAIAITSDGRTIEFGSSTHISIGDQAEFRGFNLIQAWTGTQFESLEIFADDIKESIERNGLDYTFDYIKSILSCRMLPDRKIILTPHRPKLKGVSNEINKV
ncbi:hypothetical protein LCGC14_1885270 [marine sediment metagenome]|uniref:Uncharacterized protein n=1 Tax=marine sediment metagenome TaxID=412755 RepID=A0A0F9G160_9ZZZZ